MSLRNEAALTPQIKTHCRHALRTHVRVHKPCTRQHYTSTPRRLSKVTVSTDCNRTNDHQNPSYHNHSSGMQRQHVIVGPSAGPKCRASIRAQIMNHNVGTTRWARTVRAQRVVPKLWVKKWAPFLEPWLSLREDARTHLNIQPHRPTQTSCTQHKSRMRCSAAARNIFANLHAPQKTPAMDNSGRPSASLSSTSTRC